MRTSERRTRQRGFSYLVLLFALLIGGVALASLGQRWQIALQREREAELLFRGTEIRNAIESYRAVSINGVEQYPDSLTALVEDRRQAAPRYHLRKLYLDPFTGAPDWRTVRGEDGRIVGVHSRARAPALARHNLAVAARPRGGAAAAGPVRVGDWLFLAGAPAEKQPPQATEEPEAEASETDPAAPEQ